MSKRFKMSSFQAFSTLIIKFEWEKINGSWAALLSQFLFIMNKLKLVDSKLLNSVVYRTMLSTLSNIIIPGLTSAQ